MPPAIIVKADVSQVHALARDLARNAAMVHQPVGNELRQSAMAIRARARELAPRKTGALARSIGFSSSKRGLHYSIGPTQFYGRFQEFGTVKMPAHPFMRPAAETQVDLPDRVARVAADTALARGGFSGFTRGFFTRLV